MNVNPDVAPSSNPGALTAVGNLLFFVATDGAPNMTYELWRSDGTAAGTFRVTSLADGSNSPWLSLFTSWNNALYFKYSYAALWRSDGTIGGTALFKNFSQGFNTPSVDSIFAGSRDLFLEADSGPGPGLWRSDGTVAGTINLGDVLPPRDSPQYPKGFAEFAGRVYVTADAIYPGGGTGLWATDGSPETTKRLLKSQGSIYDLVGPQAAAGSNHA